jgi:hypothetical protein
MAAVLAESELDTTCQILTTSPALTSSACVDGWLVYDTDCFSPAPWLSRGVRRPDFGSTMLQHIAAERAHVDERGAVGIRLEPAVAIGWDVLWLCDPEEPATIGLLAANIQSKRRPNDPSQHL